MQCVEDEGINSRDQAWNYVFSRNGECTPLRDYTGKGCSLSIHLSPNEKRAFEIRPLPFLEKRGASDGNKVPDTDVTVTFEKSGFICGGTALSLDNVTDEHVIKTEAA